MHDNHNGESIADRAAREYRERNGLTPRDEVPVEQRGDVWHETHGGDTATAAKAQTCHRAAVYCCARAGAMADAGLDSRRDADDP